MPLSHASWMKPKRTAVTNSGLHEKHIQDTDWKSALDY